MRRIITGAMVSLDGSKPAIEETDGVTVNAPGSEISCVPVRTVTVRPPRDAVGLILKKAAAEVGLLTATTPKPPSGPPPTDTPGPKLA